MLWLCGSFYYIGKSGWKVDVVLSYTTSLKYEPVDALMYYAGNN